MLFKVCVFLEAAALMAAASSIVVDGDPPVVRVAGSGAIAAAQPSTNWSEVLRVSVDQEGAPQLAGTYRTEGGVLIFTPRYRLQGGLAYRAAFALGSDKADSVFRAPQVSQAASTVVERVYPSADSWPENQLRFYVHFSAAMSRGEAFDRLHLIDLTNNQEVKLPFLEISEELWDRDQKRLTVLFDPGRVKRGLVPHEEAGPPLIAGRRYRLVVDSAFSDARNRPLAATFHKEFLATPGVRHGIDIKTWVLTSPAAGTRDPLVVEFPRPLDSGLLQRCLVVVQPRAAGPVRGEAALDRNEMRWTFTPDEPWSGGPHQLQVSRLLEDLAGNRLGRPFDVDVFEKVTSTADAGSTALPFTPRTAARSKAVH